MKFRKGGVSMPLTPQANDSAPELHHSSKTPTTNEYFASVAKRFRLAKYITFLFLIVFILSTIAFNRSEITVENLQYLMKFISFTNTETTISAPKINYASGDNIRLELYLGDLCYLSPKGYYLYDSRGNTIMTESITYTDPILKVSDKYSLCYDLGGSSFSVFNTFSQLTSGTTTYSITDGDISDTGNFAIATSTREYRTSVEIYDSDFKLISRILRENWLSDVKLSSNGKEIAVMTVTSDGSDFSTSIDLVTIGHDTVRKSTSLNGFGYSLFYMDGGFAVISDDGVTFLNQDLEFVGYSKHSSTLVMTDCSDKYLTAVYNSGIIGNSYRMEIFGADGKLVYEGEFDGKLSAVAHDESGEYIFILAGESVLRVNLIDRKFGSVEVESGGFDLLPLSEKSFLLAMNNYALTCTPDDFNEQYFDSEDTQ